MKNSEAEIKRLLSSIDDGDVAVGWKLANENEALRPIVELLVSIWKMTYGCSPGEGHAHIQPDDWPTKIKFMNEQEDLIPQVLTPIDQVTALDLGGFPGADQFDELSKYTSLQKLNFWEIDLQAIPEAVFALDRLEELLIAEPLSMISPKIGQLKKLKRLKIEGEFTTLPAEFAQLADLRELTISSHQMQQFPLEICKLQHLRELNLSYCKISSIPPEIADLHHLEELIMHNCRLVELPMALASLPQLKRLYVHSNPDLRVPDALITHLKRENIVYVI